MAKKTYIKRAPAKRKPALRPAIKSKSPVIKLPKPKPAGLRHIEMVLKIKRINFVEEHKFLEDRKFKFDVAIVEEKIAIEYEGLAFTGGISRHTTLGGYSKDCEKYNLAVADGWRVLRFTASNYKTFELYINKLIL